MVEIQILLVEPEPGAGSRRALELQRSAARSHASRVAHNRTKRKQREVIQFEDTDFNGKEDRSRPRARSGRLLSPGSQVVLAHRKSQSSWSQPSRASKEDDVFPHYDLEQIFTPSQSLSNSLLGQGKQDPFESYDGSRLPRPLALVLEDGTSTSPVVIKRF